MTHKEAVEAGSGFEVIDTQGHGLIKSWTRGVPFEDMAKSQVKKTAALPFIFKHVAIMPDVHAGIGATVGSVIATSGAIVPAAVGVDIGCGMCATRTSLTASDLPDNLHDLRTTIEASIPHGRTDNGGANDRGAWSDVPSDVAVGWKLESSELPSLWTAQSRIAEKHPKVIHKRAIEQLCSLGTGNHFIEVCLDEQQRVWIMLHSGSRGQGNAIGSYFIEKAKREMERWFIHLPDKDLAYLPEGSELFDDYMNAVEWAQRYAAVNRELMLARALTTLEKHTKPFARDLEAIDCHHNYVARENHFGKNVLVTRKGAVRARKGDLGIIPGSMGAKSFIVRGKGNADSFNSCSHGAGRRMSRTEAKKRFTIADHELATVGVECRKDEDVIDETPAAYKSIDDVMAAQVDLIDIVHTLRQVVCVKG